MEEETGQTEQVVDSVVETSIEGLSDNLAADLIGHNEDTGHNDEEATLETEATVETKPVETETKPVETRQPPKSWTKEMQAEWAKLPPALQDYTELRENQMREGLDKDRGDANLGRVMRDTMTPYRAMLQAQGVDEVKAVQSLLNVHYRLTNLPASEKTAYLAEIAKGYGIDLGTKTQETLDPTVKALKEDLDGIKKTLTTNQELAIRQAKEKTAREVEAFASDEKHAYFDEVADDIALMIRSGHDLETAYEKAVWANPVTRQKEIARLQTEQEALLKDKAKKEADKAKQAAGLNVKTRDTIRTPTGPRATMNNLDGALRESMAEIKAKIH